MSQLHNADRLAIVQILFKSTVGNMEAAMDAVIKDLQGPPTGIIPETTRTDEGKVVQEYKQMLDINGEQVPYSLKFIEV